MPLLDDAAHLILPFSGKGGNLALADAADLADALTSNEAWNAIAAYEAAIIERAITAAEVAAHGLSGAVSSHRTAPVLEHYRERVAS